MTRAAEGDPTGGSVWEERYARDPEDWFFGREPSALARLTLHFWRLCRGESSGRLLDLGAGEGRDAVFFAQQGFAVTAVEVAPSGIRKTERLAAERGLTLAGLHLMDMRDFPLTPDHDVLFAGNSLSGLGPGCLAYLAHMRACTPPGGLNASRVRTREAGSPRDPPGLYAFDRNELKHEYRGWRLLYYGEDLIWVPHVDGMLSFADIIAAAP